MQSLLSHNTYIQHKVKVLLSLAGVHLLAGNVLLVVFQTEEAIL